jgi:hypothetical protein
MHEENFIIDLLSVSHRQQFKIDKINPKLSDCRACRIFKAGGVAPG